MASTTRTGPGLIGKLSRLFNASDKRVLAFLAVGITVSSLLETLAISVVAPLIDLMMGASHIEENAVMGFLYTTFGFSSQAGFLVFLSLSLAGIYLASGLLRFFLLVRRTESIARMRATLSERLFSTILAKPFSYHRNRNIARQEQVVIDDVARFFALIDRSLILLSDTMLTVFIVLFLLYVSLPMTLLFVLVALVSGFIYLRVIRKRVLDLGEVSWTQSIRKRKVIQESLGAIKEIKVFDRKSFFQKRYRQANDRHLRADARYMILSQCFRIIVETICFAAIFGAIAAYILSGGDILAIMPQVSVFIIAAFRILPSIARASEGFSSVYHDRVSVDRIYDDLLEQEECMERDGTDRNDAGLVPAAGEPAGEPALKPTGEPARPAPSPGNAIEVKELSFRYPDASEPVLKAITLVVAEREAVGIIGPSGAGKSTLIDLILGLLTPSSGTIAITSTGDGRLRKKPVILDLIQNPRGKFSGQESVSKVRAAELSRLNGLFTQTDGREHIGYVPQSIYLLDDTITNNVAFGIPEKEIDVDRVKEVLINTQMWDYVCALPEGLDTVVGERGIRLSGGQRQRLGIARALYDDPGIIVFDEATSALDDETELDLMEAIAHLQGHFTLIIIAHHSNLIARCDRVYSLEEGVLRNVEGSSSR